MTILSNRFAGGNSAIDCFEEDSLEQIIQFNDKVDLMRDCILEEALKIKWNSMITFTQSAKRHMDPVQMEQQILETIKRVEVCLSHYYTSADDHRIEDFANKYPKSYFKRQWKSGTIKPHYLLAIEPHKSGHPHGHLLISHSRQDHQPNYCIKLWDYLWRTCSPNAGQIDVSPISKDKPKAAINYCTKYLRKDDQNVIFTMNLPFEIENYVPI